jgi:hypothetical protein
MSSPSSNNNKRVYSALHCEEEERSYACDQCTKSFRRYKELQNHKRVHKRATSDEASSFAQPEDTIMNDADQVLQNTEGSDELDEPMIESHDDDFMDDDVSIGSSKFFSACFMLSVWYNTYNRYSSCSRNSTRPLPNWMQI